ncbi:uncharacterized protein [Zea mays]|uniref:Uncharacterized protein n=1 Tax=Zea mays TaxID=4577 RepID=A0A804P186_MAIZE|nr:uncharacterized protein LOC103654578 [Zea mays]|eukprot:XP_008679641.1 uncharacterized protein LOC103654578 [Zea mays]
MPPFAGRVYSGVVVLAASLVFSSGPPALSLPSARAQLAPDPPSHDARFPVPRVPSLHCFLCSIFKHAALQIACCSSSPAMAAPGSPAFRPRLPPPTPVGQEPSCPLASLPPFPSSALSLSKPFYGARGFLLLHPQLACELLPPPCIHGSRRPSPWLALRPAVAPGSESLSWPSSLLHLCPLPALQLLHPWPCLLLVGARRGRRRLVAQPSCSSLLSCPWLLLHSLRAPARCPDGRLSFRVTPSSSSVSARCPASRSTARPDGIECLVIAGLVSPTIVALLFPATP